jgi:hypothetical protein
MVTGWAETAVQPIEEVEAMNLNTRRRWLTRAVVISSLIAGATLPIAAIAADSQQELHRSPELGDGSEPAVYILGNRVVAIRRSPVPPGAYGGHGVDYSPDMTAWTLGGRCSE